MVRHKAEEYPPEGISDARRSFDGGGRRPERGRTLSIIGVYLALLEIYLWGVLPTKAPLPTLAGAFVIVTILILDPWLRGETLPGLGFGVRHLAGAARALLLPTLLVSALCVTIGVFHPDGGDGGRWLRRFLAILPWALLQQLMLQTVFNRRLTAAFGAGPVATGLTAACFGVMHLPGWLLTGGTFALGLVWARVYQRQPSLWALVLGHALVSATAQSFLPPAWTHGFRVGMGYFRWRG